MALYLIQKCNLGIEYCTVKASIFLYDLTHGKKNYHRLLFISETLSYYKQDENVHRYAVSGGKERDVVEITVFC